MGVLKDIERQRRQKIENIHLLNQQSELTRELERDLMNKNKVNSTLPG